MRNIAWLAGLIVVLSGCAGGGDTTEPGDTDTDPDQGTDPDMGSGGDDPADPAEPEFSPVYINGTLGQNVLDCSDPSEMIASGSSHNLPDGAAGRSYEVTITSPGQVPAESLCIAFDAGSASSMSGTVPDDATQIIVGGDLAAGTEYSIHIS